MKLSILALLLSVAGALPAPLSIRSIPLDDLVLHSESIVIARVTAIDMAPEGSVPRGEEPILQTESSPVPPEAPIARAIVEQVWKGDAPEEVRFRAYSVWSCDTSHAEVGERVVLFLSAKDRRSGYRHIRHSGRGRMPIHEVGAQERAKLWSSGVRFPEHMRSYPGPDPALSSSASVDVLELARVVNRIVQEQTAGLIAVRAELLAMLEVDQKYRDDERMMAMELGDREAFLRAGQAADREHTGRMKAIVAKYEWPTRSLVGDEAAHAAFMLVQHADQDPKFQAMMLPRLQAAAERGEVARADVAYLTDRVRVKEQRPQTYGTQYEVQENFRGNAVTDDDGNLIYLTPIVHDVDTLDERRAAAGLEPWAEYEARMAASQGRDPEERPLTGVKSKVYSRWIWGDERDERDEQLGG